MDVAEKTHAQLSPSGAPRWTRCPGSVVLEQGMPNEGSAHSRWGTCAHEVAGIILANAVSYDMTKDSQFWDAENAESYIGRVFQIEGHDVEFDMEMADCVNDYVAHVESYWEPGDIMLVEQAVPLEQITGERDATGTSDCIIIKPAAKKIVVIDLKGGRGVQVYAQDEDGTPNEQGVMYAGGAVHEHDLMHGPFTQVLIVIIQPRLQHVDEIELSWVEFQAALARVEQAASATWFQKPDALDLNPGEKQCRFCNAKSICPALQGEVSASLALTAPPAKADEFPDLSLPKQAAAAIPENMRTIDHEQLAKAWKALPLLEQWMNAIREAVHAELHEGREVGDLCLYEGKRGSRVWASETEAEAAMKAARLKTDEMYTKKVISPTVAEKLLKPKPKVWAKLAPLIDRPDGKPVVGIRGDAKRIEWAPARPEEFPDLSAAQAEDPLFA